MHLTHATIKHAVEGGRGCNLSGRVVVETEPTVHKAQGTVPWVLIVVNRYIEALTLLMVVDDVIELVLATAYGGVIEVSLIITVGNVVGLTPELTVETVVKENN